MTEKSKNVKEKYIRTIMLLIEKNQPKVHSLHYVTNIWFDLIISHLPFLKRYVN